MTADRIRADTKKISIAKSSLGASQNNGEGASKIRAPSKGERKAAPSHKQHNKQPAQLRTPTNYDAHARKHRGQPRSTISIRPTARRCASEPRHSAAAVRNSMRVTPPAGFLSRAHHCRAAPTAQRRWEEGLAARQAMFPDVNTVRS